MLSPWPPNTVCRRSITCGLFVEIDGLAFYGQIGREGFELIRTHDLEGTVARRLDDPPRVRWLKIKKPDYSKEGWGDLFNGPRQRPAHSVGWQ